MIYAAPVICNGADLARRTAYAMSSSVTKPYDVEELVTIGDRTKRFSKLNPLGSVNGRNKLPWTLFISAHHPLISHRLSLKSIKLCN